MKYSPYRGTEEITINFYNLIKPRTVLDCIAIRDYLRLLLQCMEDKPRVFNSSNP